LMMKGFCSLGHVALKVKDIDRTLDFYVGKLGFPEMIRLNKPDGSLWIVYLRVTDDQYIEIFPGAVGERAPGWDAIGVNHFCLCVDDLDRILAQLEDAGIPLLIGKKTGIDNNYQAWIEDPDGNRIELMQITPNAMQLEALARLRRQESVPT
jgi:lactoylglutathione lyase